MTTPDPCWQQMLTTLQEIDTKVAVMTEKMGILVDHEARLRSLERLVWGLAAIPTVLATLGLLKDFV